MNGHSTRSWSAADLFPLMLLGLMGLNLMLAAPIKPPSSKTVPRTPRWSPSRPPPANAVMLALARER